MAVIQCKTCQYNFRQIDMIFSDEIRVHSEMDHDGKSFDIEVDC